ncbi:MAG TPA: hypothetical protein VFT71_07375 [Candidatus Nitrosocosmicus sp.]|nr:hypothetical protein [Candidatus Nitrosocosmicus sp.]
MFLLDMLGIRRLHAIGLSLNEEPPLHPHLIDLIPFYKIMSVPPSEYDWIISCYVS